jgi:hypothetical protein
MGVERVGPMDLQTVPKIEPNGPHNQFTRQQWGNGSEPQGPTDAADRRFIPLLSYTDSIVVIPSDKPSIDTPSSATTFDEETCGRLGESL